MEEQPPSSPLRIAWISDFPIEWLPEAPAEIKALPRQHPATWAWVLLDEFEKEPSIEVHVFVLRKQIEKSLRFQRGRTTFHVLKTPGGLRAPSLFWVDTFLLRPALAAVKPNLVHAWGTERGAAIIASRLPYPYVVTIQGLMTWYRERVPLGRYERFAAWLEMPSLRKACVVTTESRFAVGYLRKHYPHLDVLQAEHASNWRFHQVTRAPQQTPLRILSVGTLGHRKGSDLLLRALDALCREIEFQLIVVGSPNEAFLAPLRAELSPAFWERVQFHHHLSPAEIAAELAQATFTVLPTRADTSPNAVKEAIVAGTPVVASNVGGIPDYLIPEKNGLLCEPGSLESLIGKLRDAAAHPMFSRGEVDPETLQQMRTYLSPETMKTLFLQAYRRALGPRG